MSKPIILSKPASLVTAAAPTMPPAGPDRIASCLETVGIGQPPETA